MLLLEVMLGTAILGMAGVALITLLQQTTETVRQGRNAERRTQLATEVLNRISLWSRAELEAHVGRARLGAFDVEVSMPADRLYDVVLHDTLTDAPVLRTVIYRAARPIDAN
ncbi:MAG: hypothetical protein ABIY52_04825 [Gemmatimonadaceae bacterium]